MTPKALIGSTILSLTLGFAGPAMAGIHGNSAPAPLTGISGTAALPGSSAGNASGSFKMARACRSESSIFNRLNRKGYYNIHRIKRKSHTIKVRANRRGGLYQIKMDRCTGRLLWSERLK